MALPAFLFAQGAGFGAVSGVVEDASGAVVSGAHVTLDNPSKGIHRETDTTSSGNFTFQSLVPASEYTVKVTKAGFADYVVKSITVEVGNSVDIRAAMQVRTAGTEVEVTGVAPTVDFSKSDTSFVVGSKQLLELPINGRRVDAFVALSPGVSNDGAFGLLSFRGNPGGNNFTTDGVDTTNSYYGENAGRTRTYNISQDAVQEFQVVTSNYAAEFGKAAGGVVNTVTRSGSNAFHGSAYEFFRNRTLSAIDRTTVNGLQPSGINPPEWRHQAGLSIGGPIKKDKLFFFFNGELFRRNAPIVSSNIGAGAGNNVFDGSGNVLPGNTNGSNTLAKTHQTCVPGGLLKLPSNVQNIPGPTQAQCDAAVAYVTSRVIPQLIPRHMDNNLAFGKIDWHPTDKDAVSFSGNYLDFRSPNGIQTQLSLTNGNAIGNNADTNVFDRTGRASWTRILSPRAINEFRFGLFKDRQIDPASTDLIPDFGGTSATAALTVNSVSNLGYATNYPRVNPSELRYEFSDNFSWTKAKHTMKFGGTFSHLEDFVQSMAGQYPTYTYSPVTGGQTGVTFNGQTGQTITASALTLLAVDFGGGTAPGKQAYSSYAQTTGNRQVDFALWETSLFAQDEWHITPKFMLTPGIRFEHSGVPQPTVCNPKFPGTCRIPDDHNNSVAPRLGFSLALDSKTALRGGYGIFFNRYITSSIENLIVTNGLYQNTYNYSISAQTASALACLPTFPQVNPFDWAPSGACAKTLNPGILYADNSYRPSYSQQANIALEHELTRNVSLSMSYVWSRSLHLPVSYDTNVADPTKTLTYHVLDSTGAIDASKTFTLPIYTSFNSAYNDPAYITSTNPNGNYLGRVSVLQSGANSYYNAALMTLKYRGSKWFQGDVNYTWGHTIDWGVGFAPTFGSTTPSSFVNRDYSGDKGSSQLDRRHTVVVNYVVAPKLMNGNNAFAKYVANGWQIAGVTTFASSQPAAPTVSGTFSIPSAAASTIGFSSVVSGFSINGLGGSSRVPWESTSLINVGAAYRTDARLSKVFPVTERVNVILGFEAFNIFNHLIPTGRDNAQYTVSVPSDKYLDPPTNTVLNPNFGFGVLTPRTSFKSLSLTQVTPDGTTARRAQAVIRINF
jgi:hypothetical protein